MNISPSIGISISIRLGEKIALSRHWIKIYPPFMHLGPGPALQSSQFNVKTGEIFCCLQEDSGVLFTAVWRKLRSVTYHYFL